MNAGFEADGDLRSELFVCLIECQESIDNDVGFPAATVDLARDNHEVFCPDHFLIASVILGPRNAANDACGIFQIEIGVPCMSVATAFLGRCQLDCRNHAADDNLGPVFHVGQLVIAAGCILFDATRVLCQRMRRQIKADRLFFILEFLCVVPVGHIGQCGHGIGSIFVADIVTPAEQVFLSASLVFLTGCCRLYRAFHDRQLLGPITWQGIQYTGFDQCFQHTLRQHLRVHSLRQFKDVPERSFL